MRRPRSPTWGRGSTCWDSPWNGPGTPWRRAGATGGGVTLLEVDGDGGRLPRGDSNTAVVAARELLERLGEPFGVDLVLHKGMPLASGLGSSAASAAATLRAVNRLAGDPLAAEELLPCALAAEQVAAGAGHADNAAPALLGGFVLIRSVAPLDLVRLPVPEGLAVALLSPDVEIPTEAARRILRKRIPLADAVSQWGNLAALVASLYAGDLALMGRSLDDLIAEPVRAVLIPGFAAVKEAALAGGAIGCSISGAGPAVFALAASVEQAKATVAEGMREAFADAGLTAAAYVSEISRAGPRITARVLTGLLRRAIPPSGCPSASPCFHALTPGVRLSYQRCRCWPELTDVIGGVPDDAAVRGSRGDIDRSADRRRAGRGRRTRRSSTSRRLQSPRQLLAARDGLSGGAGPAHAAAGAVAAASYPFAPALSWLGRRDGAAGALSRPHLCVQGFRRRFPGHRFWSGNSPQKRAPKSGADGGPVVVLVATSGDTGGAVARAFWRRAGIEVVLLYPSGRISRLQEQQLTALGDNIHAVEIAGSFDDCQRLVKEALG